MTKMVDSNSNLVSRHYQSDGKLNERIDILRQYSEIDLVPWTFSELDFQPTDHILDAGCGSGNFLIPLSERLPHGNIVGLDLSTGILDKLRSRVGDRSNVTLIEGDVETVPFPDATFDVIMANFMLQHVKHIDAAILEFHRVLKPGGRLSCLTGSTQSKQELYSIHFSTLARLWPEYEREERAMTRFSLEQGWVHIVPVFENIRVVKCPDVLNIPDPEVVMRYYRNSIWDKGMDDASQEIKDEVAASVDVSILEHYEAHGSFQMNIGNGLFLAEKKSQGVGRLE